MIANPSLCALVVQWRDLAAVLRDEGYVEGATINERRAAELESCLRIQADFRLSIQQAALESAYSEEHLRRLLRENPQLNCGRPGKPLIRRGDLPRKATSALAS